MELHLELYMKSMPTKLYASKVVNAPRPYRGDRWQIDGIDVGPLVRNVDPGFTQPVVVELYSELKDSEIHPALDREDWLRHGHDVD